MLGSVPDALISVRVYKPAMPHEKAVDIIRQGSGSHFDPDIARAFLEIADEFDTIARRFADAPHALAA